MKKMYRYLIVMLITAITVSCASKTSSSQASTDITGKTWRLVEINGQPIKLVNQNRHPYLSLDKELRYSGHGGCNGIGGTFQIKPEVMRIKFNQGMSTMIACDDLETERLFVNAILSADNYSVNGNILSLNKARMAPLAKFILQE